MSRTHEELIEHAVHADKRSTTRELLTRLERFRLYTIHSSVQTDRLQSMAVVSVVTSGMALFIHMFGGYAIHNTGVTSRSARNHYYTNYALLGSCFGFSLVSAIALTDMRIEKELVARN